MTLVWENFIKVQDYQMDICLANGHLIKSTGIGRVEITIGGGIFILEDVFHVPDLDGNLLSIGAARKHGITIEFGLKNVL